MRYGTRLFRVPMLTAWEGSVCVRYIEWARRRESRVVNAAALSFIRPHTRLLARAATPKAQGMNGAKTMQRHGESRNRWCVQPGNGR